MSATKTKTELQAGITVGAIVRDAEHKTIVRQTGTIIQATKDGFVVRLDDGSEIEMWR